MISSRFGYWALVGAAVVVAAIGVMMLAWGLRLYARIPSAGSSNLMIGGVVFVAAGGYAARWLLERAQ